MEMVKDIYIGRGGFTNPDADVPCGPKNSRAEFLEPVHWGDCKGCAQDIKARYLARRPPEPKPPSQEQSEFDFMAVDKPTKRRKAKRRGAQ